MSLLPACQTQDGSSLECTRASSLAMSSDVAAGGTTYRATAPPRASVSTALAIGRGSQVVAQAGREAPAGGHQMARELEVPAMLQGQPARVDGHDAGRVKVGIAGHVAPDSARDDQVRALLGLPQGELGGEAAMQASVEIFGDLQGTLGQVLDEGAVPESSSLQALQLADQEHQARAGCPARVQPR